MMTQIRGTWLHWAMNGIHDMGGMTDFGPVVREPNEPAFHADWERRVWGMVQTAISPNGDLDRFRFAIERLDPITYLSSTYYQRWLSALETCLLESGAITSEELQSGHPYLEPGEDSTLPEDDIARREQPIVPFRPGDPVMARNVHPAGHTRMPRYVRGKPGTVERVLGTFIFPDTNALGRGAHPEPCYAVRFHASELWGESAAPGDSVCVDLWHSYLQAVR